MPDEDLTQLPGIYSELSTATFQVPFTVPNVGSPGTRFLTAAEITALEVSVYLIDDGAYITTWLFGAGTWAEGSEVLKNVNVKNTGRGVYTDATGVLALTLHAGDMPCIATGTVAGAIETHEFIVTGRYNADLDQFHARARFKIMNLGKVPRVP